MRIIDIARQKIRIMQQRKIVGPSFDAEFYLTRYPHVIEEMKKMRVDALTHFLEIGWKHGFDPNERFSTAGYINEHDDVAAAGMNPYLHYLLHGKSENRILLESSDRQLMEVVNSFFDKRFYLAANDDVARSGADPVQHYLTRGWREGRNPHPDFVTNDYLRLHPDVRKSGINPLVHYLNSGREEGRATRADPKRRLQALPFSPRILFVGHSGNSSGAEIMLLNVIKWYSENTSYHIDLIILSPGPLLSKYSRYCNVYGLNDESELFSEDLLAFLHPDYAYIYVNTVASGAFASIYKELYIKNGTPIVLHGHEMQRVIEDHQKSFEAILPYVSQVIAASTAVKDALSRYIPQEKIEVVYSFIDAKLHTTDYISDRRRESRKILGLGSEDFVIMGAGTVEHRKAPDIFVEAVKEVVEKNKGRCVRAVWLGGGPDLEPIRKRLVSDGLEKTITFVGFRDDAADLLSAGDLFFLSSREDPFPLVCLEAAQYGVPTVFFEAASGIGHLTREGAGVPVEQMTPQAAASAIDRLLRDDTKRLNMGLKCRARVAEEFDCNKSMLRIFTSLRERFNLEPAVSVVVPNYNHELFIAERLTSVTQQTLKDIEIIVLDDSSSDRSLEFIDEFRSDPRIQIRVNKERSGSAFKQWLNGVSRARAKLVWIAESDDYCTPDLLEVLTPAFNNKKIVISFCKTIAVDERGKEHSGEIENYLSRADSSKFLRPYANDGFVEVNDGMGFMCTLVNASSALFRTGILVEALPLALDYSMCGDWVIYLAMLKMGGISYSDKSENYFRRHKSSIVHKVEGTEEYFRERARIARFVVDNFFITKKTRNRIIEELEYEWMRFKHIKKMITLSTVLDKAGLLGPVRLPRMRLKVAFYVHGLLFSKGGIERQAALLANALSERGCEVTIFCRVWSSAAPVFELNYSVTVVPIFDENRVEETSLALRHKLIERDVEVFVPMLSESLFEPIVDAAVGLGIKIIVSEHNDPWKIEELWWSRAGRLECFSKADAIHLLMNSFIHSLPEALRKKVAIIPNGIDMPRKSFEEKKECSFRIIAVGRLERQKRFDRLINAFARIQKRIDPRWHVDIYGEGSLHHDLSVMIKRLGLQSRVRLRGRSDSIQSELCRSDFLVLPSEFEGFGIVLVEAKIASLPSVGYMNCNGVNEIIKNDLDGVLVDPDEDGASLADACYKLIINAELRRRYGRAAVNEARQYEMSQIVERWVNLLAKLDSSNSDRSLSLS